MDKMKPLIIRGRDIFDALRKPLPQQTGGAMVPKTTKRNRDRQTAKAKLKKGDWE